MSSGYVFNPYIARWHTTRWLTEIFIDLLISSHEDVIDIDAKNQQTAQC